MFSNLSRKDLETFLIEWPDNHPRAAIAHILGTLDDKIELNRKMNETLEAIARAIFKSWFVDFDPVRAKMEGRQPGGMDAETAALFPDSFVESELGEIPRGWRPAKVKDLGGVICGKTPPTKDAENYGNFMPFVTIPDMHSKVFVTRTKKRLSAVGVETQKNKTLPALSICVSCIATPGLVAMTSESSQTNQQINSVIPHADVSPFLSYFALRNLSAEIRTRGSGGSVVTNLNKGQFSILPVLLPPPGLIRLFHRVVEPLLMHILANEHHSCTLAAMRDTLLPKLLSGEIDLSDAKELLREAKGPS